jgi:hypothetical protein
MAYLINKLHVAPDFRITNTISWFSNVVKLDFMTRISVAAGKFRKFENKTMGFLATDNLLPVHCYGDQNKHVVIHVLS